MSLTALAQAVMLGTERDPPALPRSCPDAALAAVLEKLDARPDSLETRALATAAVLAPYEEAGRRTLDAAGRAFPPECPPEEIPLCSAAAAAVLRRILDEQKTLVPEWLARAASRGARVPPSLLPRLLEAGRHAPGLVADLARVVGRRGLWLAAQNPAWSYVLTEKAADPDERDWQEGPLAARKGYLKALRARDPETARQRLREVWDEENAATRADLLSVLQVGLVMDDEPFLEDRLDDKSKQVRAVAARLLGILPRSRRARRMAERCRGLVRVERKLLRISLEVEAPGKLDAAAERDGLTEKNDRGLGKKAARLMQVVAETPTPFWTDELGLAPGELVKALRRHTWRKAMMVGLSRAAVREQDADLALALLGANVDKDRFDEEDLIRLLPSGRRDEYLIGRLRDASDDDLRALLPQLDRMTGGGPWSQALGRAALERFAALMRTRRGREDWHLHDFLATLATRLPLSLVGEAASALPRSRNPIPSLENKLNDFDVVLDLRLRIYEELPL